MNARAARYLTVVAAVSLLAVAGCGTPHPSQAARVCVGVSDREQVLWTESAESTIVVGSLSGPFDPRGASFFRVRSFDISTRGSELLFEGSSMNGLPSLGEDGSLWWMEQDGLWTREPGGRVRRVRELDGGSVYAIKWTKPGVLILTDERPSQGLDLVSANGDVRRVATTRAANDMWASSNSDVLVFRGGSADGRTTFLEIRSSGTVRTVAGLPAWTNVAWISADAGTAVLIVRDEGLFTTATDRADPTPLDIGIPRDVTVVSAPSSDGRAAYHALSGMKDSEVCLTDPVPAALRPG